MRRLSESMLLNLPYLVHRTMEK